MLKIENVPYRRWLNNRLVDCKEGKRVMALMFKEMKSGRAVDFRQNPPLSDGADAKTGKIIPHKSGIYDTISLTITD